MKWFKILGFLMAVAICQRAQAQTATVTWATTHQTIDGFGGYDNPNHFNTSASFLEQIFSPTQGVGLSILREGIPDASTLGNTSDFPGDCSTVNSGCANVSPELTYAISQGVRIFSSGSPPASMKTNGSLVCDPTNSGTTSGLAAGAFGAYATWLSNYIASMKQYAGAAPYAISPQNEPDTCTNGDNPYGGAVWTAAQLDTFIKTNLGPTLSSAGQTSTLIGMPESGEYLDRGEGIHTGLDSYASACINDSSCAEYVSVCATHDYEQTHPWNPPADSLCANANKHLWQTEIYQGSTYDGSMSDGLIWAQDIHNWMTNANASAWIWFEIFSPWGDNESLYSCSSDPCNSSSTPSKRLFVIGQWSKFVRPGWARIATSTNPQTGVYVSAFKSPSESSYAIVAINTNNSPTSQTFALSGFPSATSVTPWVTSNTLDLAEQSSVAVGSSAFTFSLPAQSVTTFVGTLSTSARNPVAPPSGLTANVK
jgi:glucuronoarabinoxylan endo-1,4-beta-xylanase